jgi:hypothetical protein
MEPAPARPRDESIDHDDLLVHEWRVTQLTRPGIPWRPAWCLGRPDRHRPRAPAPAGGPAIADAAGPPMARLVQRVWGGATEEERRVLRSNPIGR